MNIWCPGCMLGTLWSKGQPMMGLLELPMDTFRGIHCCSSSYVVLCCTLRHWCCVVPKSRHGAASMGVNRVKLIDAFQILLQGPCPQGGPPDFPEHRLIVHLSYFHLVIKHFMLTIKYKQIYGIKLPIHTNSFCAL